MWYVAELYTLDEQGQKSIDATDFQAEDDAEAKRKAQEWAIPVLGQMIGEITHLQVTAPEDGGRSVFSKKYGEL